MNDFDFKTRSFEWQSDDASRMICHYQTSEGRIWLVKDKLFWKTCVKREGHVGNSNQFVKFAEAVDWVEKEIVNLANKPDVKKEEGILCEEEIKANRIRLKAKFINGPYWIDATQMDPQRITYQILIDLETKPISYKSFESICGDTNKIADRYPTPGKLANDIHLDAGHFQISQMLGDNSEHFRLPHSQIIIKKNQWQSKPNKSGIKAGYCNYSKQEKSFADDLDIRKSRQDILPC